MTFTEPSGPTPGKIAGFALLGIAVVAAVIGVVTLIGGNGDDQADPNPPSSSAPSTGDSGSPTATSSPDSSASSTTGSPTTTTTSASATAPITPSNTAPVPAPGDGQAKPSGDVRVLNNSQLTGLAARAADDLRAAGWNVVEVGNYTPATNAGNIPTTTVYYRPGTDEKAVAETLAAYYGMRVEPRFDRIADLGPGVIVIVTNDYKGGRGK